jgi:predicted molibdopterin-dependent oxidoreductase YjgC
MMKKISPEAKQEVFYRERELTEVEKVLMSPDRSPNFRGARHMGVGSEAGVEPLLQAIIEGRLRSAYIVGEDLVSLSEDGENLKSALGKLSFLVVQDIRMTPTAALAHVVLPATHFGEKAGTYTNRRGRVQKLEAAIVPPAGALQDWEIFSRLLGESYAAPEEIFAVAAREVPAYAGLDYEKIGALGADLEAQKQ